MKKSFLALLCILPMLLSCVQPQPEEPDDPTTDPVVDPVEVKDPAVTLSGDKNLQLACEAGTVTVSFTANRNWTVTPDGSWITVNPESGFASESPVSVVVTYEQNPKTTERDTYITIAAESAKVMVNLVQAGDPYAGAAAVELKSGDVVLANSELVEKFLTDNWEYPDWPDETGTRTTKVFDYYGGFDGTNLTWANWETDWPDGDLPSAYSIRWKESDMDDSKMVLHMEDELGWKGDLEVKAGSRFVNVTNLVPNDKYTYKVTSANGKTVASGKFSTKGSIHQVFFTGPTTKKKGVIAKGSGCRNARDLGGWTTLDGKKVKYRKIYRGGRMNEKWTPYPLNAQGEKEVLFEGIGAELDLRGNSDVIFEPAVAGLAHCAPVIEQGGKTMLVSDAAKTKECFMFVLNCVRENKPIYFHCSLGRDRTGTLDILLLGLLGVREGVIAREYEITYFAPVGYSVSSSDKQSNPKPLFKNTRLQWVYSDVVPYFWELAAQTPGGTFAEGVEKYLLEVAGVSQKDIDDFRALMLE